MNQNHVSAQEGFGWLTLSLIVTRRYGRQQRREEGMGWTEDLGAEADWGRACRH